MPEKFERVKTWAQDHEVEVLLGAMTAAEIFGAVLTRARRRLGNESPGEAPPDEPSIEPGFAEMICSVSVSTGGSEGSGGVISVPGASAAGSSVSCIWLQYSACAGGQSDILSM